MTDENTMNDKAGPAPRATSRPIDVVTSRGRPT